MTIELHNKSTNGSGLTTTDTMAPRRANDNASAGAYEPGSLRDAIELARMMAGSDLVPRALRNSPANITLVVMAGKEMGLGFTQSMRMLHVVDGKIVSAADLIVAMVKRSPECLFFRMVESTDKVASYETQRRGDPGPTKLSYTIEQAQRAGLAGKDNWKKHPEAMLRARCSAALARIAFPDLAAGMYDTDEGDEIQRRADNGPTFGEAMHNVAVRADVQRADATNATRSQPLADLIKRVTDATTVPVLRAVAREVSQPFAKDSAEYKAILDAFNARMREIEAAEKNGADPRTGEVIETGEHEPAPAAWTIEKWTEHMAAKTNRYEVANSFAKHESELEAAGIHGPASDVSIDRLRALGLDEAHAVEAIAKTSDMKNTKKGAA
jgi:hypothetical protein